MPAAIVAVAGMAAGAAATGAAVAAGWVAVGSIGASIIGGVASLATTAVLSSAAGINKKQSQSQSVEQLSKGVLLNTAGTVDPLMVVYGRRRIGGTRVLTEASGASNEHLHIVIAHCEGPIDAIETVYLDGVATTDAKFSGLVTVETFLGADDQAACQSLIDALPGKWTAAHRLRGVAYTYVRLTYNSDVFSSLPTITVDVRGRTVHDPRTGLTAWSQNPALCVRDYLTHARYGRGVPVADVDEAMFIAAANDCEVSFTAPDSTTHPRHTCNGVINTDQSSADNMVNLLSCCRGMLIFSARGYGLLVDKAQLPSSFSFTEDNITGGWSFCPGGKRSLYNRVRGNWFNPANEWQPDIAVADSTPFRTIDNGLMLEAQVELPFTISPYEATVLTERHLRQSRFGMTATFRAFIAGMFCEVGDVVPITHSTPGWVAKPFRITRISLLSSDEVEVEVAEYDDAVYSATPLTAPRTSPITNLPDPSDVPPPTDLSVATTSVLQPDGSRVPRFVASWTAPASVWVVGYDIAWREDGGPWDTAFVTEPRFTLSATAVGRDYDVRVRSVGSLGTKSVWVTTSGTQTAPTVGPAAPTATATGGLFCVQLAWTFGDSRKDIRSTEIWFASANNRAASLRLSAVPFPGTSYTHPGLAPGAGGYYWLRVVDNYGNASAWFPGAGGLYAISSTDASSLLQQLQNALGEPQLAAHLAARIDLIDGAASLDGSVAQRIDTLQSALGTDLATVQEFASVSAGKVEAVEARWGVKVQAMADGVQALGGIEILSGAQGQSTVAVLANKFLIYKPDGTGTPKQMLTLGTVNGVNALGLDGNMIIDGTVVARSIDSRGLAIRDEAGNIILGSGSALTWNHIASVGQNLVRSLALWSFEGSPGFWLYTNGTSAEDGLWLVLEDTASTVLADSPQLVLPPGEFTVSFDACVISGGSREVQVDLFPDDLPQSAFTISGSAWKAYQATWSSSSASLADCRLRIFSVAGGPRIYIRNVKLEIGPAKSAWSAHPFDSVTVRNPITAGNASTYIANAAIDTLTLAGSAVTVPVVAKLARTIEGAHDDPYSHSSVLWSLPPINRARIYLSQAGIVYAHAIAAQWYGQGERYSNLGVSITDSTGRVERVMEGGGAVVPAPVVGTSLLCSAGWVDVKVHWVGQPGCRITDCIVFAQGAKR